MRAGFQPLNGGGYAVNAADTFGCSAGGVLEVAVMARPVIGILPTVDEIVPPSANPAQGDVMEFNSTIFSGMLIQWGAEPRVYPILRDDPKTIRQGVTIIPPSS